MFVPMKAITYMWQLSCSCTHS